jgi:hypothetical protein
MIRFFLKLDCRGVPCSILLLSKIVQGKKTYLTELYKKGKEKERLITKDCQSKKLN